MYLFENDATGKKIINALKEAALRQVAVYIVFDGLGSLSFPSDEVIRLKETGINIRFFAPLFSTYSFYIGRRLHSKIVVADEKIALIGGINIADKYHGSAKEMAWLDYAVQLKGEVAIPLQQLCSDIYLKKRKLHDKKIKTVFQIQQDTSIRILQNDWLKGKDQIYHSYIYSIRNAKKEIIIVGSYFLPGVRIIRALKKASKNKVAIKLILSGKSDLPLTRRATCFLYEKLLQYNIELYEWDKSVLHGKAAVIDGKWSTIGSFNLNNLSSYGSLETNVEIISESFAIMFREQLNQIILQCHSITQESLKAKNTIMTKFINLISYIITRIIEKIITYTPFNRFYN